MSIDSFKSAVTNFARPTLYRVEAAGILDQSFEFLCKAAQIPASTLGVIEVPYMGRKIKVAGDRTFAEWTITIQQDESYKIRKQFEEWSNGINDHVQNVGPAAAESYKQDMKIQQLAVDGSVIAEYSMVGCFPMEIGAIEMSFETNDAVAEYTVTIAFDYWTPSK